MDFMADTPMMYLKLYINIHFNLSCPQPKPSKGRMRIHMLENVDKALTFLKQQKVSWFFL